jgi:hypothetical protein
MGVEEFQARRAFAGCPEMALEKLAGDLDLDVTDDGSLNHVKRTDVLSLALMVHYIPELDAASAMSTFNGVWFGSVVCCVSCCCAALTHCTNAKK